MMEGKTYSLRLQSEMRQKLAALAQAQDRKASDVLRRLIRQEHRRLFDNGTHAVQEGVPPAAVQEGAR